MTLTEAKKNMDHTLAALFYERMKNVRFGEGSAQETYKMTVSETNELLIHMRGRLDILFGEDSESLAQFLYEAGVIPRTHQ